MIRLNIYRIFAFLSVFLPVISCQRIEIQESAFGYLYVSMDKDISEELVFKSSSEDETVFSLKIYNVLGQLVSSVDDYRKLQESPLQLNVGSYTAVASSAEAAASAAFDSPFYSGSAVFDVLPDQVSNIDIVCSLANVKVTAVFSDDIKSNFSIYRLTVSNGEGTLVFSNEDDTVDREGYFSATGTLTWSLYLENNDGQKYTALTETYSDVKAKQHYNLSFSLQENEDFGGGAITILVNNSLTDKEYDVTLDFGDETLPQISANFDYSDSGTAEYNVGDNTSKIFDFSSTDGFSHLFITYGVAASGVSGESGAVNYVQADLVGASKSVISDLAAAGIIAGSVEYGATSASVDITSYVANQPIGTTCFSVLASDVNGAYEETSVTFVLRSPVETEAVSAEPWAEFATVKGKWFTEAEPEGLSFQYRKSSDPDWTDVVNASVVTEPVSRTYSAEIKGLVPETEYIFRAVSAKDKETKEIGFTTETAGTLPNMSFDSWYQSNNAWYPNVSSDEFIWDSANGGTANLPFGWAIVPTTPTSDVAVSGEGKQAAQLKSGVAAGNFAAGNIYTGKFGNATLSPVGAKLDWGVPFTSRPLALKGYFKYSPVSINYASSAYEALKGTMDKCQIQVILTDWDSPFNISTGDNRFVDIENDPAIIAYGSFEYGTSTDGYQPFVLNIDYRDKSRTPKYIVVVAAASRYGDYYTGGEGSTLLLDEFEFIYNPDLLSE